MTFSIPDMPDRRAERAVKPLYSTQLPGNQIGKHPFDFGTKVSTERFDPGPYRGPMPEAKAIPTAGIKRRLLTEATLRMREPLDLWRPFPLQGELHRSRAHVRVALGGNRSGKTQVASVEFARAITNSDPYRKYPKGGQGDMTRMAVAVAKEQDTIGKVIYEKLFEPGSFKVIRDEVTRLWRGVDATSEYDKAYKEKWRDADPLIPPRLYNRKRDLSWYETKDNKLSGFRLRSCGWKVAVYSQNSDPKVGFPIDLGWIDEEGMDERWLGELEARTIDREGCLLVSATPEQGSNWLLDLDSRFEDVEANKNPKTGGPIVEIWALDSYANPFHDHEELAMRQVGLSPEMREVKSKGVFARANAIIFNEFNFDLHTCSSFTIPRHWTRYIAIDPGVRNATAVFLAVPPPEDPDHRGRVYVYHEEVVHNCHADTLAVTIKKAIEKDRCQIERFVIDGRYANQRSPQTGDTNRQWYREAFERHGVESNRQGADFTDGVEGHEPRILAIHDWLRGPAPTLQIFREEAPILCDQLRRYMRKRNRQGDLEKAVRKKFDDAVDALGYLAHFKPGWVMPKGGEAFSPIQSLLRKKRLKEIQGSSGGFSFSPGQGK